jgi:hypothetical protein
MVHIFSEKALTIAKELLKLLLNKEDQDEEALFNAYGLFGQILLHLNNKHVSEQAFKKQLELAEQQKSNRLTVIAHSNLAIFYSTTNNQVRRRVIIC